MLDAASASLEFLAVPSLDFVPHVAQAYDYDSPAYQQFKKTVTPPTALYTKCLLFQLTRPSSSRLWARSMPFLTYSDFPKYKTDSL